MRTIKFRGKTIDWAWIIGDFVRPNVILEDKDTNLSLGKLYLNNSSIVIQDTIGQFTGLTDADGNEIYEGDLLLSDENAEVFEVVYDAPRFCFKDNDFGFRFLNHPEHFHVIGNRYDNPDLIEKGGKQ